MAEVRFKDVSKVYDGDVQAVTGLNLTVEDESLLVLVGPSGCGKSTVLRMVAGLEELTAGEICIDGQRVNDVLPKDRDIAMVFQNYALYPHMTVYGNMAFGLKLHGYPKQEIERRVRDAASLLGITPLLGRRPRDLSGGQAQRVAVGRAIVRHPRVFLFDEPLSNLDAQLRVHMRVELARLHRRLATTMIYVTHDQVEAMTLGQKVAVMNDGRLQQVAGPVELYARPVNRFVAWFIGSPAMNFIPGRAEVEGDAVRFVSDELWLALPRRFGPSLRAHAGRALELGIRPEDIQPTGAATRTAADCIRTTGVEVVEPLGAETLVHLHIRPGGADIVARFSAEHTPRAGGQLDVAFNTDKAHVFDAGTGASLTYEIERPEDADASPAPPEGR